jgi:hypothetical protein
MVSLNTTRDDATSNKGSEGNTRKSNVLPIIPNCNLFKIAPRISELKSDEGGL